MDNQDLENQFKINLERVNDEHRNDHVSSGLLSPSKFTWPKAEIQLSLLMVQADTPDYNSLLNFLRGNTVEKTITTYLEVEKSITTNLEPKAVELQVQCDQFGCTGFADAVTPQIVHEFKAPSTFKFKRLQKEKAAQYGHILQAAYYAICLSKQYFKIHYIEANSYQWLTLTYQTDDYRSDVLSTISDIYHAVATDRMLDYDSPEPYYMNTDKYLNHKWIFNKKGKEIEKTLKEQYPLAYKKLKDGVLIHELSKPIKELEKAIKESVSK